MSAPNLSNAAQFQYMIQWFEEWSDFQRQDFLPILAGKLSSNGTYVNGLVDAMGSVNCQDKPMSLFQCRVKLFNDWFGNWTPEDRNNLVSRLSDMDESFGVRLNEELSGNKQIVDDDHFTVQNGTREASVSPAVAVQISPVDVVEAENREVIDDADEVPRIISENPVPIQIAE